MRDQTPQQYPHSIDHAVVHIVMRRAAKCGGWRESNAKIEAPRIADQQVFLARSTRLPTWRPTQKRRPYKGAGAPSRDTTYKIDTSISRPVKCGAAGRDLGDRRGRRMDDIWGAILPPARYATPPKKGRARQIPGSYGRILSVLPMPRWASRALGR